MVVPACSRHGCDLPACSSSKSYSPPTSTPASSVQMGSKRGKVTVEFADLEDLERIYRLIVE